MNAFLMVLVLGPLRDPYNRGRPNRACPSCIENRTVCSNAALPVSAKKNASRHNGISKVFNT